MKKILVIHNQYREVGGEDIAVRNEVEVLSRHFIVEKLYFSNNIDIEKYFSQFFWFLRNKNSESLKKVEEKIDTFNPDIVYVHNTWFKASPAIFKILQKNNIKSFVKLHNFRFDCTKSYFSKFHLKGESACKACGMQRSPYRFLNRYYEDSILKSLIVVRFGRKYFKILKNKNIQILTLTNFQKEYLEDLNFNTKNINIHRNYLKFDDDNLKEYNPNSNYIVYAGRISREKGIQNLIDAYLLIENPPFKLKIVGNGPLLKELKSKYYLSEQILFLGQLPNSETKEIIQNSRAVVTATSLYEGQPTLLCEASLLGIPSIYPNNGGIKEFFPSDYKLSYDISNKSQLTEKMNMLKSEDILMRISSENKQFIQDFLNEDKYLDAFKKIINV